MSDSKWSYEEYLSKYRASKLLKLKNKVFSKLARNTIFPRIRLWAFKKAGNNIAKNVFIGAECYLDDTFPELIHIEENVTISFRVILIAHKEKAIRGDTEVAPVHIKRNVFIGAGVTVLPGVTIGENVVVGAGAVVTTSIESNLTVVGIPARKMVYRGSYKE